MDIRDFLKHPTPTSTAAPMDASAAVAVPTARKLGIMTPADIRAAKAQTSSPVEGWRAYYEQTVIPTIFGNIDQFRNIQCLEASFRIVSPPYTDDRFLCWLQNTLRAECPGWEITTSALRVKPDQSFLTHVALVVLYILVKEH